MERTDANGKIASYSTAWWLRHLRNSRESALVDLGSIIGRGVFSGELGSAAGRKDIASAIRRSSK
jgi:hypothetical protein